jgi:uncharacterized protein (TIGR02118 family)
MIAAISLMRRRDDITLTAFRRHWLDVHGPLVCAFPALRGYAQHHVIGSAAMNQRAHQMRIDGFPILWFDNDEDRHRAHRSAQMAACNDDSRDFIGAVSRVICEAHNVTPRRANAGRIGLIALLPGERADDAALERYADWARELPGLPAWRCFACCSKALRRTARSPTLRSRSPASRLWLSPAWSISNARLRMWKRRRRTLSSRSIGWCD